MTVKPSFLHSDPGIKPRTSQVHKSDSSSIEPLSLRLESKGDQVSVSVSKPQQSPAHFIRNGISISVDDFIKALTKIHGSRSESGTSVTVPISYKAKRYVAQAVSGSSGTFEYEDFVSMPNPEAVSFISECMLFFLADAARVPSQWGINRGRNVKAVDTFLTDSMSLRYFTPVKQLREGLRYLAAK